MQITDFSLRNWMIMITCIGILSSFVYVILKLKSYIVIAFSALIYLSSLAFIYLKIESLQFIFLYQFSPSFLIGLTIFLLLKPAQKDPIWDIEFRTNKGTKILRGVQRGIAIFGAAGSGKTISVIYNLIQHFAREKFSGIIYDFKDGELTELAIPAFGNQLRIVAVHQPEIGYRVNPIDPKFLNGEKDVNEIVTVIMDNLISSGVGKGDDFFKDSASSLLSSVILKFSFTHPEYCTLPHIISFILGIDFSIKSGTTALTGEETENKFGKLHHFLTDNERVALQGSPFIMGLSSERQTASVISTLANALRKISFPEAFWALSGNEISFDINSEENHSVISIINEPKSSRFLSPINATIIHAVTKQMMVRGRKPSFLLLDEAPTIKLLNMAQIPATMRSFGVAVVYCAQDIVQGTVQYGRDGFKEIIANLSTQFFGKSNDPDTSKFYESFFELIKQKTKSVSTKGAMSLFSTGETSTTIGEKEVSKFRASKFNSLKVGEFAFLSDGNTDIVKIKTPKIEKGKIPIRKKITQEMLERNFNQIIQEAKLLID
ncbi:type IV secretory system conjugative DNA transfer family protein (plasmid) [Chryseobacterium balustinum]|nr:type IV secretory system conjugative DNA transfer family protein [Chryseobacterium balustinum]